MDKTIAGAIIAAIATIAAAIINKWPSKPPTPNGIHPSRPERPAEAPTDDDLETRLRDSIEVRRLFKRESWRIVAEAAVNHLLRQEEPINKAWKSTGTWSQVVGVYQRLRLEDLPASSVVDQEARNLSWPQLLAVLQERVPAGTVTTYGRCSRWAFGHPNGGQGIRSMLQAAARRGNHTWTNRVVFEDGSVGAADDEFGQSAQLLAEGLPFIGDRVDLAHCTAVELQ